MGGNIIMKEMFVFLNTLATINGTILFNTFWNLYLPV